MFWETLRLQEHHCNLLRSGFLSPSFTAYSALSLAANNPVVGTETRIFHTRPVGGQEVHGPPCHMASSWRRISRSAVLRLRSWYVYRETLLPDPSILLLLRIISSRSKHTCEGICLARQYLKLYPAVQP